MTDQNNQIQNVPQASQHIVDAAKRESHQWLNPETWRTMQMIAQTFVQSGAMPKSMDTAPKVIVALQAGKEAGLQPLEAINSFYFVNGKVSMYGEMAIGQVLKAGHIIEWGKCDAETATVKIIRGDNNKMSNEVTFTMKMAQERGLTSNPVYKKYPENMLRFKAFHACAKFIVSDALHGVPIKEVEEAEYVEEMPVMQEVKLSKIKKEDTAPGAVINNQDTSLEAAINKPEMMTDLQYQMIASELKRVKKTEKELLDFYGKKKFEEVTKKEAEEMITILKKAKVEKVAKKEPVKVEEMPKENNRSHLPPEKPGEGRAAKAIRAAANKNKKVETETSNAWPEDVCRYLRFIDGIPDKDLPDDMIELKKDGVSGNWKGYDYYPNLRSQIESLPKDFK